MKKLIACLLTLSIFLPACDHALHEPDLYELFRSPPADARPMVRWWWNGNAVEAGELKRELKVMHEAGIGGVEINSIAMPLHAEPTGAPTLQWAGSEWCDMVKVASEEARELGMITDLIVGSGWPFGGRFLGEDEIMQRLGVKKYELGPNEEIHLDMTEVLKFEAQHAPGSQMTRENSEVELLAVKLIPVGLNSLDEIIDLSPLVKDGKLKYRTGDRDYVLVLLYNERNFMSVYHGAPGADGPIMDHYKREVVRAYLDRLKAIERETGVPLAELVRALFCDSIELGGSNWTDDMAPVFRERKGYDIMPYLPFVVQPQNQPNTYETSEELADHLRRVQYDFYQVLIEVFLERFTREFQDFCTENGVLCRYQAYGTPYYMGLFQGNLIPDIPESNNWIYSRARDEAESDAFTWNQGHGYMLWNKAASTGAHINGRQITSCEAMTNTQGVFRASLETIKQSDDMNFITGINHTVLHGFNYSPPEAGFPGWIRYGAYFSEQNTWWKYFRNWADYNARLSAVFQHSDPVADLAIVGRMDDLWAEVGPARPPFNTHPWYYARLWEPISNLGSSCDYLHSSILEKSETVDGKLICGNMAYSALILTEVRSLSPLAAEKISAFASDGGKVVFIGQVPERSLSLVDAENNDLLVHSHIQVAMELGNVHLVPAPEESADLLHWTASLFERMGMDPPVNIGQPVSHLYSLKQVRGEQEIYFFVNSHRSEAVEFDARFHTGNLIPYLWDPRSGERFALACEKNNKLRLRLDALESALVVFEPEQPDLPLYSARPVPLKRQPMKALWEVRFEQVDGRVFTRTMEELIDFSTSADEAIRNFSGTVTYSTVIEDSQSHDFICLEDVNQAVSELRINGESAGMRWYGNHTYEVGGLWKTGSNRIEIILTTTLANYCGSLTENQTAMAWTRSYETPVSSGLVGVEWGTKGQKYGDGRPEAHLRMDARDHGVVLRYGDGPGQCDMLGARDVWVFEANGTYYMHYDAAGPKGWLSSLAVSKDLVNWQKRGSILDFGTAGEEDAASASYGVTFYDGNTWHMFYLGTPNASPPPDLVPSFPYLTMKARGTNPGGPWIKQKNVIPFRTQPGTYYSVTASPGHVIKHGDEYLQFFSSTTRIPESPYVQRTLGMARTMDLDGSWRVDPAPLLPVVEQVENSSLYYEKSNKTWFLFTNHIGLEEGREFTDAIWVYWSKDLNIWDPENKAIVLDGENCSWSEKCIGLPSVLEAGQKLAIFYDAPGGNSTSHMKRNVGLAWLDLPLTVPGR